MVEINPLRVIVADDHTLVRAGFCSLVRNIPGVEVVAEAEDGHEALDLIDQHRPDIVLMDITMPRLNGLDVAARVVESYPHVRVIILSMHPDEEYVLRALRTGVAGYLIKDAGTEELEMAIQSVAQGKTFLSPSISEKVAQYVRRVGDGSEELLTSRQREVLQLIAEGLTNREIAESLGISVKTVESHRTHLMNRLEIHDVAGLVRYAIRVGLIDMTH
jgi:DNA-binding NarL/FixJ family response regulator